MAGNDNDPVIGRRTLYLECYSGISGDMAVGALLDLGADRTVLEAALDSLDVGSFRTEITEVSKSGLRACDFNVILDHDNHDHDDAYLYGNATFKEEHACHSHRGLKEIRSVISSASMTDRARSMAYRIFDILADAESKVHGVPKDDVHFHEVGAVDSIVDVVSFAVCLDNLGIDEAIVSDLYDGTGTVRCQHGVLPIPVPAVSNIVSDRGLHLHIMDVPGEYVTPTGAAMAAAVRTRKELPSSFSIERIGLGAGKRRTDRAGVLRAMIIADAPYDKDSVFKLECNIDDCSGEALGFAMDRLMRSGAKDVHFIPAYMKKDRPAYILAVICAEADVREMERIIFEETTTIGIRRVRMDRTVLQREIRTVITRFGDIRVKICCGMSGDCFPEYDDVAKVCRDNSIPYRTAYSIIMDDCKKQLGMR